MSESTTNRPPPDHNDSELDPLRILFDNHRRKIATDRENIERLKGITAKYKELNDKALRNSSMAAYIIRNARGEIVSVVPVIGYDAPAPMVLERLRARLKAIGHTLLEGPVTERSLEDTIKDLEQGYRVR